MKQIDSKKIALALLGFPKEAQRAAKPTKTAGIGKDKVDSFPLGGFSERKLAIAFRRTAKTARNGQIRILAAKFTLAAAFTVAATGCTFWGDKATGWTASISVVPVRQVDDRKGLESDSFAGLYGQRTAKEKY